MAAIGEILPDLVGDIEMSAQAERMSGRCEGDERRAAFRPFEGASLRRGDMQPPAYRSGPAPEGRATTLC